MSISAMPKVGLGLWKIAKREDCAQTVYDAIAHGVIDI